MKRIISICIILLTLSITTSAQVDRVAVGLSFAEKIRFNNIGDTGNPGINLKTWIDLDRRKTMSIVPSLTAFRPHTMSPGNTSSYQVTTYLFHGDIDFQYRVFTEKTLSVVAMAGVNYSQFFSTVDLFISMTDPPTGDSDFGIGPNIGAGLEMRMGDLWDFNVGAKYAFPGLIVHAPGTVSIFNENKTKLLSSPYTALVIHVQAVYYFKTRRKGYRR